MKHKLTSTQQLLLGTVFLILVFVTLAFIPLKKEPEPVEINAVTSNTKIDEKADKILKEMSKNLAALKTFSFTSSGYFEVVVDSIVQKIQITNAGKLWAQRPDKLKVERIGEKADLEMFFNKGQFSIYGKKNNMYATASTGENIDKTIDYLRENLNIYLPAGDLLYSDVYAILTEDVVSGAYVGQSIAGNVLCDHLAFAGNEVDWQIWVESSGQKLPRRYVITSRKEEGMPEFAIEISEWNTNPKLKEDMFTFNPPKGAMKIDFLMNKDAQTRKQD